MNLSKATKGWINGALGVIIFSGSLPATRLAVIDIDPVLLTICRATIAGLLAGALLLIFRQKRPLREEILPLILVSLCVVVGFPLLTAIALQYITSAHSIIYVGLLPLATAIFGVWRGGERPSPMFWIMSILGSGLVAGFALTQGTEANLLGDSLVLIAVIACGYGYAEGGILSRRLGGWQVISWALVLALPVMIVLLVLGQVFYPFSWGEVGAPAIGGLLYVSLFSMFIGFVFWYRGLAMGGIAAVGQLQLLQPFLSLLLSAFLLNEEVDLPILLINIGVVLCVAVARRFAVR